MRISVCQDCKKRVVGCRGTCEDYQRERKALDDLKAEIWKKKWNMAEADDRKWKGQQKMASTPKVRKGKRYKGET